jgi:beta-glucosidase
MRRFQRSILFCLTVTLLFGCGPDERITGGPKQPPKPETPPQWPRPKNPIAADPKIEERITELLGQMTLEQKVSQMVQADIRNITPADLKKYPLGSILNGGGGFPDNNKHASVNDWVALADRFYNASIAVKPGIPIMWGTDAVHGHNNVIGATLFPHNIGLGAAHNPDLIERIGEVTAREVAATGIDWTFAPVVAVVRDDRWGRTYEAFSEDPEIVKAYAGRFVKGVQGAAGTPTFLDGNHVLASAKHYIGDGGTAGGIDRGDNRASEKGLIKIHAQGYVTAMEAGVQTIMASYNTWDGWKVHGRHYLLSEVLKDRMGFDGLVVSDWDGIDEVQGCSKDKCAPAVNAGIDLFMVPTDWKNFITNTLEQIKMERIPQSRIDDAVRRILRVKLRAGMFEKGKPSSRPLAGKRELIGAPEHRAVARQAVRESLVLLKNSDGLLPLKADANVLVAGSGADNISKQAGGWTITWQGTENTNADFPGATSIYAGIRQAVTAAGGKATLSADGSWKTKPDVAIVVFGEDPYAEWFGDIRTLDYQGPEGADHAMIARLAEAQIPTACVFLTGRPLFVGPELDACNAFVVAWLPGSEGGGVADVLLRDEKGEIKHDFVGKLSFSWPKTATQTDLNRDDPSYDPLFAYGFGLTYAGEKERE